MFERSLMARWFLIGGAVLLVLGLVLWFALPIKMSVPPYLFAALLALVYGAFCLLPRRRGPDRKS